jgi:hypothetical protein
MRSNQDERRTCGLTRINNQGISENIFKMPPGSEQRSLYRPATTLVMTTINVLNELLAVNNLGLMSADARPVRASGGG